jgi:16S rRNA (adenine1518-N6/adenine1519-N6)-dimethyltransferase
MLSASPSMWRGRTQGRLKKRFGQHFLSDRSILRKIVALARIDPNDTVVEIGPGGGALTRELAAASHRVVAIEIDRDLVPALRDRMPSNVEIVEADALTVDLGALAREPFHLVGNLPYNVATPLFKRFIEFRRHIHDATVMVQKEVAQRIVAKPGSGEYGPLTVLVQYYAEAKYGFTVPPGAFHPRPRVDSAVIRLEWRPEVKDAPDFTDFVHRAFSSRRKKLANNLTAMFPSLSREAVLEKLHASGIEPGARPEELSISEFERVYNQFGH